MLLTITGNPRGGYPYTNGGVREYVRVRVRVKIKGVMVLLVLSLASLRNRANDKQFALPSASLQAGQTDRL
jgi:hypothetical protein